MASVYFMGQGKPIWNIERKQCVDSKQHSTKQSQNNNLHYYNVAVCMYVCCISGGYAARRISSLVLELQRWFMLSCKSEHGSVTAVNVDPAYIIENLPVHNAWWTLAEELGSYIPVSTFPISHFSVSYFPFAHFPFLFLDQPRARAVFWEQNQVDRG